MCRVVKDVEKVRASKRIVSDSRESLRTRTLPRMITTESGWYVQYSSMIWICEYMLNVHLDIHITQSQVFSFMESVAWCLFIVCIVIVVLPCIASAQSHHSSIVINNMNFIKVINNCWQTHLHLIITAGNYIYVELMYMIITQGSMFKLCTQHNRDSIRISIGLQ